MLKSKIIKLTIIVLSVIIGLWLLIIVALQVLLKTSVLDRIIGNVAAEYVDGDVHYSRVRINVVKSFPNLNVTIDSLSLTYPHGRWSCWDTTDIQSHLLGAGRGTEHDTLASFETLSASVDYVAAICGRIRSRGARLSGFKLYAHQYGDGQANWQMFRMAASDTAEVEDTTSFSLPPVSIGRIVLDNHPRIVYTAQEDTVFLALDMNRLVLHGDLEKYLSDRELLGRRMDSLYQARQSGPAKEQLRRMPRTAEDLTQNAMESSILRDSASHRMDMRNNSIALHIDSLFVGGRLPSDTLGVFVNLFDVQDRGRRIAFEMDAGTVFLTRMAGRLRIPVHFSGEIGVEQSRRHAESVVYQMRKFNCSVAYVPVLMNAMVRRSPDSLYVNAALKIDDCPIGDILEKYGKNFSASLGEFHTDARLTLMADCKGFVDLEKGLYPAASVTLSLPEAAVSHDHLPGVCQMTLNADASLSENGRLDASLRRLLLDVNGLNADFSAQATNLLEEDPLYMVQGKAETRLDDLVTLLPDSVGPLEAEGRVLFDVDACARQSYLCKKGLTNIKVNAVLGLNGVRVNYPKVGLVADVDSMTLKVNDMKSLVDSTQRAFGARLALDSLHFTLGENLALTGTNLRLMGNIAAKKLNADVPVPEFKGKLMFDRLSMVGSDSLRLHVRKMDNTFTIDKIFSPRANIYLPRLSLVTKVDGASVRMDDNRFGIKGIKANLSAVKRRINVSAMDSLAPKRQSFAADTLPLRVNLPDFMTEKDFERGDIDVKVNELLTDYLNSWFPRGQIAFDGGRIITPVLPLRNRLDTARVRFNGFSLNIDRLGIRAGSSKLSAAGSFRRINPPGEKFMAALDMDITSEGIDVDELLVAWDKGRKLKETTMPDYTIEQSVDEEFMESLLDSATQQLADTITDKRLIVVPANLLADVRLRFDSVRYSKLLIDTLKGSVVSKGRCLQLTDWKALSNMGTMRLDAFYSTRTKKDIAAGFNLGMQSITAQEVVGLIPLVDSVMPMLKTFKGDLDCELTATAQLDTFMNIKLPTLDGVFKISGRNLGLEQSAALRKIARLLLFRNKWSGDIDDMSVYGMISNNMMEIFPFILNIDRYTLALEGRQDLNNPFEYYFSVISSPLPFQFGISLYGDTYDEWKYRLGPTKYTHSYYIPLFHDEVDSVQVNLATSIKSIFDKGVDLVLRENASHASSVDSLRAASRDMLPVDEEKRKELEAKYREQELQQTAE